MTKHCSLLLLGAGMMLFLSPASAVTVLSITGSPNTCASTGGNAGNRTTGIVAAMSWIQASGYSNVTISAALDNLGSSAFSQFTAYLTKSIGPGTTTAQEIAHSTVTGSGVAVPTATLTTLFTGLNLPAGTYFVTIFGDVNGPALGPECWTFSTSAPTIVTASGVSGLTALQTVDVAAYPPASSLAPVGFLDFLQVTGDPVGPPTFSKSFGQTSVFAGTTATLTFTIQNTNTSLALTGLTFTDTLPAGLLVATPNGLTNTCGGTATATAGGNLISLSGGTLAVSSTCTITVTVAAISSGTQVNTTSVLTSNAPTAPAATASIVVFLTLDGSFQVAYAANPAAGESYINLINDGANGAPLMGPGIGPATGNICVNVYAFSPDEQEISCCSCLLTPNQVKNLGVNRDLTSKTLTGVIPTSVVIKLVSTLAGGNGGGTTCTGVAAIAGSATAPLASGMVAFGTTPQPVGTVYKAVEHTFLPSTLSPGELASITNRCANIIGNGSSFGVCASCQTGALGADKQ